MTKSKKAHRRIISFTILSFALLFILLLFLLHVLFPNKYTKTINEAAQKYQIDASLICAVIWTESKYDKTAVSNKGAIGLMQLLPSTAEFVAKRLGYQDFDTEMLKDERTNIDLGCYYLRYLMDKFKDEQTTLAAYNAGEGNVASWQKQGIETIPFKETKDYIKRVQSVKKIYRFKAK